MTQRVIPAQAGISGREVARRRQGGAACLHKIPAFAGMTVCSSGDGVPPC